MSRVGSVATLAVMTAAAVWNNTPARALDIQPSSGQVNAQITSCLVFSVKSANKTYDCTTEARKAVHACDPTQACEIPIGYNLTQGKDIDPGTGFLGKQVRINFTCADTPLQAGPYQQDDHASVILDCGAWW